MMTAADYQDDPANWSTMDERAPRTEAERVERTASALGKAMDKFSHPCEACRGTGRFHSYTGRYVGPCRKCKGRGKLKTSAEQRQKSRQSVAERKQRQATEALETYRATHPEVMAWIEAKRMAFDFAASLYEAIRRYGDLTERQLAAAQRLALKDAEREVAREKTLETAPKVDMGPIVAAFATASKTLQRPRLRIGSYILSLAPANGKNAGAIYVKETTGSVPDDYDRGSFNINEYRGKVADGRFVRSRETTDAQEAEIVRLLADPKGAAISYGRVTGNCACCGRQLIVKESIDLGIGPICAEKWGW